MRKGWFIFMMLLATVTCKRLIRSVGKSSDVVVIASQIDENLIAENVQLYNYVPHKEGTFTFIFAGDTALNDYKHHHAILLYGSLHDDFISTMLNKEAYDATAEDTFTLFKLKNLWAHEQITIILAVRDPEYLAQGFAKYGQLISQTLEEHYYQRVKRNYYDAGISSKMKDQLKKYGMTLDINQAWLIDSTHQEDNFIFIHTHFPDRSIFFYKELKKSTLNGPFATAKRDSLTERYYNGDYILKELTRIEPIEFANLRGIRLKGVWQNDTLIAGGPFLSYFLSDGDTLYILDGIVFNPGERKTDYLTKIEVILNSFSLIRP
jgi:hypothetical protein